MSELTVYLLALLPAVLWGLSPVFSKRGMAAGGSALQASLVVVVVDSLLFWAALVALQGVDLFANLTLPAVATFAVAGVVGTSLGRLATFVGVHRVGASVNSAGISTRPLFATLLAVGWLGETVSPGMVLGIVVLIVGLVVLALAKGGDIGGWRPRDLLFPLAAAFAFGLGNVLRKFGLDTYDATVLEAVALNETAALVALGAFLVARRGTDVLAAPRETYGYFAVSGTLTAFALASLFAALELGRVAVVDPLAATAPLFTTLFSAVFLRDLEVVTRGVVAGALLVVVGVGMVTAFSTEAFALTALVGT
ncbi:DMT family transporter [Halospeciosus flavus]|uniref:EamA family transporter n=1 Tax=Halospeciosus flavus TaxID=3032283 RepID=A0ABD5Z5R6_9EURY|nr:DMT family transporter [Halospeciosus flavus]